MRQWMAPPNAPGSWPAAALIDTLAEPGFERVLLQCMVEILPVTSMAVHLLGPKRRPERLLAASRRAPDTTHDCWRAYLSGPWRDDQTLAPRAAPTELERPVVCHITASEVPGEHRTRVYEAYGMRERVSVVRRERDGTVFAVNFYRHEGARPFSDCQLDDFGRSAASMLALTRKHVALREAKPPPDGTEGSHRDRLIALCPALTRRELDVCVRLLAGRTHDSIAAELELGLPTVRTYRNRAFDRLGIHFRNELFALVLA